MTTEDLKDSVKDSVKELSGTLRTNLESNCLYEGTDRWYLLFGDGGLLYRKEYIDGLLTQIDRLKHRSDVTSELEKFAIDIISRGCYASK